MKLTRQQLKQIIKEELEAVLEETDQLDEEEDLEEGFKGSTDVGVGYNPDDPDKEESEATIVQRQWRQQNQKYSDEQREKEKTKPKTFTNHRKLRKIPSKHQERNFQPGDKDATKIPENAHQFQGGQFKNHI